VLVRGGVVYLRGEVPSVDDAGRRRGHCRRRAGSGRDPGGTPDHRRSLRGAACCSPEDRRYRVPTGGDLRWVRRRLSGSAWPEGQRPSVSPCSMPGTFAEMPPRFAPAEGSPYSPSSCSPAPSVPWPPVSLRCESADDSAQRLVPAPCRRGRPP
jgi:hypothetical protein